MQSFKPKDHSQTDKCDFGPFKVLDAYSAIYAVNGTTKVHAYAQLSSNDNALGELKHVRYTLVMLGPDKVLGVKYHGYDNGQGYEICTMFVIVNETTEQSVCSITPGAGGEWLWEGEVSRSLFRADVTGTWEMRLTFSLPRGGGDEGMAGRKPVGKLIVPYEVTKAMSLEELLPAVVNEKDTPSSPKE